MGCNSVQSFSATIGTVYAGYEYIHVSPLSAATMHSYCSGVSAGIYTTRSADICQYILNNSKSEVVMVDDHEQNLSKIVKVE